MRERIHQLDYLKGIFILLMVLFHLAPVYENYPVLQAAVYTFHMAAFLIISGYLANIEKDVPNFCRGILRFIIPYIVFEIVHILLVYLLGNAMHSNSSVTSLTLSGVLDEILENPSNPYWYLHTLIITTVIYYVVYKVLKLKSMTAFILTGLILYGLTLFITRFYWVNAICFLIGVYISRSGRNFLEAIPSSPLAVIPLCILFSFRENYHTGTFAGITITILVISFLLFVGDSCILSHIHGHHQDGCTLFQFRPDSYLLCCACPNLCRSGLSLLRLAVRQAAYQPILVRKGSLLCEILRKRCCAYGHIELITPIMYWVYLTLDSYRDGIALRVTQVSSRSV